MDVPFDPVPADADPFDHVLVDADPFDPVPADADPFDSVPVDADPFDPVPADADPFDSVPVDADPFDSVPADAEPIDLVQADADPIASGPSIDRQNQQRVQKPVARRAMARFEVAVSHDTAHEVSRIPGSSPYYFNSSAELAPRITLKSHLTPHLPCPANFTSNF